MSVQKILLLDANILIRAVLGERVLNLLKKYELSTRFYSPDICFVEARKHLSTIFQKRAMDVSLALEVLDRVSRLVVPVDLSSYEPFERVARQRIERRDPGDWPIVATALFLRCPIWTEDQDFFGAGVPTWTTDRVELYLEEAL